MLNHVWFFSLSIDLVSWETQSLSPARHPQREKCYHLGETQGLGSLRGVLPEKPTSETESERGQKALFLAVVSGAMPIHREPSSSGMRFTIDRRSPCTAVTGPAQTSPESLVTGFVGILSVAPRHHETFGLCQRLPCPFSESSAMFELLGNLADIGQQLRSLPNVLKLQIDLVELISSISHNRSQATSLSKSASIIPGNMLVTVSPMHQWFRSNSRSSVPLPGSCSFFNTQA